MADIACFLVTSAFVGVNRAACPWTGTPVGSGTRDRARDQDGSRPEGRTVRRGRDPLGRLHDDDGSLLGEGSGSASGLAGRIDTRPVSHPPDRHDTVLEDTMRRRSLVGLLAGAAVAPLIPVRHPGWTRDLALGWKHVGTFVVRMDSGSFIVTTGPGRPALELVATDVDSEPGDEPSRYDDPNADLPDPDDPDYDPLRDDSEEGEEKKIS
jgi:hypothetical protein